MILKIKDILNKDARLHDLISGGAISFFMQCTGMLSGYVLMAVIANYFGARILGVYSLSSSILTLGIILSSLGMDMVILKIAGKREKTSSIVTLRKVYSIVAPAAVIISCMLIAISYWYLNNFFNEIEYKRYLIVTGVSIPLSVILAINIEYLRAGGGITASEFLRNVFRPFISLLLIITTCLIYYDVYIPGYAMLIGSFFACIFSIYMIYWQKHNASVDAAEQGCNETARTLVTSGLSMQASMLAFYMISNMVIFFIKGYESSALVGVVLVAIKLAGLINMPLMVFNKVCAPRFSKLYSTGQYGELQEYLGQVTKLAFYMAVVVGVFLLFFSEQLLSIFGNDFVQAKNILFILVLGQLVSCASGPVGVFMMMTGNERAYRNIAVIVALISFAAYSMIMPVFGVRGAAYVLAGSQSALNIASVIYIKYRLGFVTMYLPFGNRFYLKKS